MSKQGLNKGKTQVQSLGDAGVCNRAKTGAEQGQSRKGVLPRASTTHTQI